MPRSTENLSPVTRPGNNIRAFSPHVNQRRFDHWRRQMAVYAAVARRQDAQRRRAA